MRALGTVTQGVEVGPAAAEQLEEELEGALSRATGPGCPPRLAEALRYAVVPGGARLRPRLCLLVASACGDGRAAPAMAAAASIELIHCASLVHDDLPCFDDAEVRRGRPSVHRAFGEPLAVLVGDALIVSAFQTLASGGGLRAARMLQQLADAAGSGRGIVAGQGWESEPEAPLEEYHRAKTAGLFEAAAAMGAIAVGADPTGWGCLGEALGRAYQAADDLRDALSTVRLAGKSVGRDAALNRPSLVRARGARAAQAQLQTLIDAAIREVPPCAEAPQIQRWIQGLAAELAPVARPEGGPLTGRSRTLRPGG